VQQLAAMAAEIEEDARAQVVREEDLREIERESLLLATEEGLAGGGASEGVTSLLEDLERSREEHADGNAALQFKLHSLEEATAAHEEEMDLERVRSKYDLLTQDLFSPRAFQTRGVSRPPETPARGANLALGQGPASVDRAPGPTAPELPFRLHVAVADLLRSEAAQREQGRAVVDRSAPPSPTEASLSDSALAPEEAASDGRFVPPQNLHDTPCSARNSSPYTLKNNP